MESFWDVVSTFAVILGIIWMIRSTVQLVKAQREYSKTKKELKKITENMILQKMYNVKRAELNRLLNDLNMDYMLGIEVYEIEEILEEDTPKEIVKRIAYYMDKTPITVEIFCENVVYTTENVLRSSGLSFNQQEEIMEIVKIELSVVHDELLKDIVMQYEKDLPDDMRFLRGKINYMLVALGLLRQIAEEIDEAILQNHIESIRRQRGYI